MSDKKLEKLAEKDAYKLLYAIVKTQERFGEYGESSPNHKGKPTLLPHTLDMISSLTSLEFKHYPNRSVSTREGCARDIVSDVLPYKIAASGEQFSAKERLEALIEGEAILKQLNVIINKNSMSYTDSDNNGNYIDEKALMDFINKSIELSKKSHFECYEVERSKIDPFVAMVDVYYKRYQSIRELKELFDIDEKAKMELNDYIIDGKITPEMLRKFVYKNNDTIISDKSSNHITIGEKTNTFNQLISNFDLNDLILKDSFEGKLLKGRIQMAADKGYMSERKTQQDAVGSFVKDENHFINILCDGVGGYGPNSVEVSTMVVNDLINWYKSIPSMYENDVESIAALLSVEVKKLDEKYSEKHAGATLVLSLTVNDKTIIANVGDSFAYSYNHEDDSLIQLSTFMRPQYDSYRNTVYAYERNDIETVKGSYENIRRHDNQATVFLGTGWVGAFGENLTQINIIENEGQRIILTSDGVTDLVSEENYKKFFTENYSASQIVNYAKSGKDFAYKKSMDNISAIVVDLPNYSKTKRRGM